MARILKSHMARNGQPGGDPICKTSIRVTSGDVYAPRDFAVLPAAMQCTRCLARMNSAKKPAA